MRIDKGFRKYVDEKGILSLKECEYGRDSSGVWYARPPGNHMGCLSGHEVVEHDDGTITVSPSIEINDGRSIWHGYLRKGIWETL